MNHSIDRINPNGNYGPGNVRWATPEEQSNNFRHNRRITHNGIALTASQWAKKIGISKELLYWRVKNWSLEEALDPNTGYSTTGQLH